MARYDQIRLGNRLGWILSVPGRPGQCPDGSGAISGGSRLPGMAPDSFRVDPDSSRRHRTASDGSRTIKSLWIDPCRPRCVFWILLSLPKSYLFEASLGSRSVKLTFRELRQECLRSTIHVFQTVYSLLSKGNRKICKDDRFNIAQFGTEGWSGQVPKSLKKRFLSNVPRHFWFLLRFWTSQRY